MRIMKHLAIAFALLSGVASGCANSHKADLTLENENLILGFDRERLALISLKDAHTGHEFLQSLPDMPILWYFEMERADGSTFAMHSGMKAKKKIRHSAGAGELTLIWSDLEVNGESAMEVRVMVRLPRGADRSHWRIEVDNHSKCSLMHVQFPYISGLSEKGQPDVAVPRNLWGKLEREVTFTRGSYPCSIWPMQFLALLEKESGLYLAYEDPTSSFKYFDLKPGDHFFFTTFAQNATQPGNGFVSPGPVAIGVCGPDWWTAAKMYREWALQQKWTSRGPLTEESSVPNTAKEIGIWFNEVLASGDVESQISRLEAARDFYRLPMAMQVYTWHKPAFDTRYPEYFPARPDFPALVQTLKSADAFVVPYVNGRLQDLNVPSAREARAAVVKKRDNSIPLEDYQSGAKFTVMCPATEYWQDVMRNTAQKLVDEYKVNGIYYDQIAAAEPVQCFDSTHGHAPGGGSHWAEGYRKMLTEVKNIRTDTGKPLLVSSEDVTECYMDTVDAFLLWTPRHPDEIPLLTAVYSGYSIYFGSNAQVVDDATLQAFAMIVGRDILWGTQPGWMNIDTKSERGYYLRDMARVRHAARRFFQYGELLGELKSEREPGNVTGFWKNINHDGSPPSEVTLPAVMSTVWKSPEGALGVAIANLSGEEKIVSYRLNPEEFGIESGQNKTWRLRQIDADGEKEHGNSQGNKFLLEETLQPWELRVLEISSKEEG